MNKLFIRARTSSYIKKFFRKKKYHPRNLINIQYLKTIISLLYKYYLKKLTAILFTINIVLPPVKLIIKPIAKTTKLK